MGSRDTGYLPNIFFRGIETGSKMFKSCVCCILLAALLRSVYSLQLQTVGSGPNDVGDDLTDTIVLAFPGAETLDEEPRSEIYDTAYYGFTREKRSTALATIGLAALKTILTGTKKIRSQSKRHRKFQKQGDFDTAKQDFYSVNPRNVKTYLGRQDQMFHQVGILTGNVGNRRLILNRTGEKGYPMLDVIENKEVPGQYVDRIIYK